MYQRMGFVNVNSVRAHESYVANKSTIHCVFSGKSLIHCCAFKMEVKSQQIKLQSGGSHGGRNGSKETTTMEGRPGGTLG